MNLRLPSGSLIALATVTLLISAGCSVFQSYPEQVRYAQNAFADEDFEEAVWAIEKISPPERDRLCFLLELGTVYHAMGDYESSNAHFLRAVEVMEEFDERAVISVRDSAAFAASLLVNDKARPYRGSPFERVLLHTYLAMNFLLQRDLENARVEILQAYEQQRKARQEHSERIERTKQEAEMNKWDSDVIIARVHGAYEDQRDLLEKAGNVYQNAFTYYLSSLVYELGGEISDAYIDAKTVHSLNPNFLPARRDLLRFSKRLGLRADYEKWREQFGDELEDAVPAGHGEVVLIHQRGLAPVKEQIKLSLPIPLKDHWTVVTIALPKYRSRPSRAQTVRLLADGQDLGTAQALMDVEATAVRDLWNQAPGIALRQLLRAAGRVSVTEYARRKGGDILFIPLLLLGHAMEQADLRSWISLPREFQVLRTTLPAGPHDVVMELVDGRDLERIALDALPVREGGVTVVNLRSFDDNGTADYVEF